MGPEWIVIGVVMTLLAGGVGAAAIGAELRGNDYQDRVEAIWRGVAEALGGALEVSAKRSLEPRTLQLTVELDEVEAQATLSVPFAAGNVSHTRATARYLLGVGPRFRARPRGVHEPEQPRMPRALLADEPGAAAAFGPEARYLVDSIRRALTIRAEGDGVEVLWDGAEADPAVIENVLRLAAAIARFGSDHLRGLSTLDDAEYEPRSDEGPRVRVRRGLVDVRFVVAAEDDAAVYLARVRARAGTPEALVQIDEGGAAHPEPPPGLVAPSARAELARVAPARLRSHAGQLEVVWDEGPSLEQARAAVHLLAEVGASEGAQGAFR